MKLLGKTMAKAIIIGGDPAARIINWSGNRIGKLAFKVKPDYRLGLSREQAKNSLSSKGLNVKWDPLRGSMVTDQEGRSYLGRLGHVFGKNAPALSLPCDLSIRELHRLDDHLINAIMDIEKEAFLRPFRSDRTVWMTKKLSNSDFTVLFLDDKNDRSIGCATGYFDKSLPSNTFFLFSLSLMTEYRGRGLGKVLLKRMFAVAKSLGYKKLALSPLQKDIDGRDVNKFYRSMGFRNTNDPTMSWIEIDID